jgi:hypothetical protein
VCEIYIQRETKKEKERNLDYPQIEYVPIVFTLLQMDDHLLFDAFCALKSFLLTLLFGCRLQDTHWRLTWLSFSPMG